MKLIGFNILIILTVSVLSLYGQQPYVKGLEGNEEYMTLINNQNKLRQALDSTQTLINSVRKSFETVGNDAQSKEKIAKDIVRLEAELYEIRTQVGRSTAQSSAIEQEYVIQNMGAQQSETTSTATAKGSRSLFNSQFFKSNLTAAEINNLNSAPAKVDPQIREVTHTIDQLYGALGELKVRYDASDDQDMIDSMVLAAGKIKEQIEDADAQVEKIWITLYNQKLDNYLMLIDKLGTIDRLKLEQLDVENRAVRRAEGLAGEQLAPLIATYPLQKRMALDYEIALAEALVLAQAKDSLTAELKKIPATTPTYQDITFQPRNLVVYSPITKHDVSPYPTSSEVPQLKIPRRGIYYTIQLSAMSAPATNISIFKGMMPLMQEKMGDGRIRYAAGGFRTYAEAQTALNQMVKAGFRAPVIVAWIDGVSATATKAKAAKAASAASATTASTTGAFTVDIQPNEGRLPSSLRDVITANAPGKTILRTSNNGAVIYSIGNFTTQAEAQSLLDALLAKESVKAKITTL